MKKLLALLILLAAPAWSATFYVNTASVATCDGTTTATTDSGDHHCAWPTVAKVNAASFSPGDSVLFNKGDIWRESLGVGWSGSAGSPITFGAYGTGNAPEINGSDIFTTWNQEEGSPTVAEQQLSYTTTVHTGGTDTYFEAQGFSSDAAITVPQIDVNIKKVGSPSGNVWIEIWATTGSPARPTGGAPITNGTSATIVASTISTTISYVTFTFSTPPSLSAGAIYFMILRGSWSGSDSNCIDWGLYTSDGYRGDDPYCRHLVDGATPPVSHGHWNQDFQFKVYKPGAAGTVYSKAGITTEPNGVWYNGTQLTQNDGATTGVGSNEWDWASNTLYVNVGEDPDTHLLEAAQRANAVSVASRHYVTISGIEMTKANGSGVYADSATYLTLSGCTITYAADYGIVFGTASGDNVVDSCELAYNGYDSDVGGGVFTWEDAGSSGHENYIKRCTIHDNIYYGINLNSNYYIIEQNLVYDNGGATAPYGCNAIELVGLSDNGYGQHNVVRYNLVYGQVSGGNDGDGIVADDYACYNEIYGNVCHSNDGPGIYAYKSHDNAIYNNTCYHNMVDSATSHAAPGAEIGASTDGTVACGNIVIKNNIGVASGSWVAVNVDSNVTGAAGFSVTNNDWYAAGANWYSYSGTPGNNLATWNALTGVGTDLNSDPAMTNAAGGDFTLTAASPCRDVGANLGSTYQDALNPISTWPDGVALLNQNSYGSAWEIGAYVYKSSSKPHVIVVTQ